MPGRFLVDEPSALGLWDLSDLVTRLVRAEHVWRPLVRHDPRRRWYTRLLLSGVVEVWLIGWYPGQRTEVHDHGGALGALAVAEGAVDEDECGGDWATLRQHRHRAGALVNFEVEHVHRIVNRGQVNATTIHAYSPPELPLRYAPARGEPVDRSRAVPTAPAQVADRPVPAGVAL